MAEYVWGQVSPWPPAAPPPLAVEKALPELEIVIICVDKRETYYRRLKISY